MGKQLLAGLTQSPVVENNHYQYCRDGIAMGHLSVPVYFKNKGDFSFEVYRNPNYLDYSILHAIQNYDLVDVNKDGKMEIFLGGEHYHGEQTGAANYKNLQVSLFNKAIDKNISSKYFYYNNKKIDEEAFSLIKNRNFNKKKKFLQQLLIKN